MTDDIIKALHETEDALLDEAQDQLQRAEALDWESLEKHFREVGGYDDEEIAVEKEMFDSLLRTTRYLADYGKKKSKAVQKKELEEQQELSKTEEQDHKYNRPAWVIIIVGILAIIALVLVWILSK
jgi:hypothetical protein